MSRLQLVPECFAETALVKALFKEEQDYLNHAPGIHRVSAILKKRDVQDFISIGFIDKDKKNAPKYFDEFIMVESIINVEFKKHPDTNDYLILVIPAIEKFILNELEQIDLSPSDFNLPSNFNEFKKIMKKQSIGNNTGYKSILRKLAELKPNGVRFIYKCIATIR